MDGTQRRCIGLDVHRDFAQVAICQGGQVVQAGTFATTPEGVREFAAGLGPADEVHWRRPGTRGRSSRCWPAGQAGWWWPIQARPGRSPRRR